MPIRPTLRSDSDLIERWQQSPSHWITSPPEEHDSLAQWFETTLTSDHAVTLTGSTPCNTPTCIIRSQRLPGDEHNAMICMTADPHGRDHEELKKALHTAADTLFTEGFCHSAVARINKSQPASRRLFEEVGFVEHSSPEPVAALNDTTTYSLARTDFWRRVNGIKCLAIIPARGGSKRIPRKNIRHFLGKPIISYSIEAALSSGIFDRVVVSTDCAEIAEVARYLGADVPFLRPMEISDDTTPLINVLIHALETVSPPDKPYTAACCLLPTAPFITAPLLTEGYRIMKHRHAPGAFTVTSFSSSIYRAFEIKDDGCLSMIWPDYEFTRSNDLPPAYHDAGQFYWVDPRSLLSERKVFLKGSAPIILPRDQVQDIDTPEVWLMAELLMRGKHATHGV